MKLYFVKDLCIPAVTTNYIAHTHNCKVGKVLNFIITLWFVFTRVCGAELTLDL